MRKHHTKNKGDLGLLKTQLDLYEKGFTAFTTTSEHQAFDLIAYKSGGRFLRIQVKYRTAKCGRLSVELYSNWTDKNGTHKTDYDKDEVDYFAVYCPDTELVYYLNVSLFDQKTVTLRLEPTKNNQTQNILLASDFLNL